KHAKRRLPVFSHYGCLNIHIKSETTGKSRQARMATRNPDRHSAAKRSRRCDLGAHPTQIETRTSWKVRFPYPASMVPEWSVRVWSGLAPCRCSKALSARMVPARWSCRPSCRCTLQDREVIRRRQKQSETSSLRLSFLG